MMEDLEMLGRVALAGLLATPLGWEREWRDRPAGLRTHIVVGIASALLVVLSRPMVAFLDADTGMGLDPTRVLLTVVTGVAFLGAGTIFVHRDDGAVRGLTTAGSLLATAAIGTAAGLGELVLAVGSCALVAAVVAGIGYLERSLGS